MIQGNMNPALKKQRVETIKEEENEDGEQEEALIALIEHRAKEVDHLKNRLTYYQSQLKEAEKRLHGSESQLARLQARNKSPVSNDIPKVKVEHRSASPINIDEGGHSRYQDPLSRLQARNKSPVSNDILKVKVEHRPASPINIDEGGHSRYQDPSSRPQLVIPAVNPKISQPVKLAESTIKASVGSGSRTTTSSSGQSSGGVGKLKGDASRKPPFPGAEFVGLQDNQQSKMNFEQREHTDLVPSVCKSSKPSLIRFQPGTHFSSQHKRKLRSLALNPVNDQLFMTSALDGIANLWQIQGRGSSASLLSTTDCASPKQRRWPEDITWHPHGYCLFFAYTADGDDSQVAILNLNSSHQKRVTFLEEKPHFKGIINCIVFMPGVDLCFATGGSDHAVILWNEKEGEENLWKPKVLHRNIHSSAVMGVAGMQQKHIVLSVGADKRIIGFDSLAGRANYRHQIESKCMSVLPNPSDFNLFMVQTGTHEKQLHLYDIRLRQTEIHTFGWKQEASESQSALVNQAWSPDGWYLTSGSADPVIHIFDIRYNGHKPSQSVKAHQKRVFKAAWHHSFPLLISISSDLQIGLHKIIP